MSAPSVMAVPWKASYLGGGGGDWCWWDLAVGIWMVGFWWEYEEV